MFGHHLFSAKYDNLMHHNSSDTPEFEKDNFLISDTKMPLDKAEFSMKSNTKPAASLSFSRMF